MPGTKATLRKNIVINKKYKFRLEIYLNLEGHDSIAWEIFPENYESSLYAFSNKTKLDKLVKNKYVFEPERKYDERSKM